ncbi:MAG: hypothetical protein RLZZ227_849 [Pseudomonadota bacterium]|jgi:hypothetical protein
MKAPYTKIAKTLGALALTLLFASAEAHHSFSMFDRDTQVVVTGTVARWAFNNPHSWLYLNVKNADGKETLWSFEGAAPPQLVGRGITGATFEPGDSLTLMFCPLADGRDGGALGWVKLADESFVIPSDGGCRTDEATVTRWQDWLQKGYRTSKEAQAAGV